MEKKHFLKGLLMAIVLMCPSYMCGYDFSAENEEGVTIYYGIVDSDEYEYACEVADDGTKYAEYEMLTIPNKVLNENDGNTYTVVGVEKGLLEEVAPKKQPKQTYSREKGISFKSRNEVGNPNITE